MDELERLYYDKEMEDIKAFCIKHGKTVQFRNQPHYLYDRKIYDKDMNIIIEYAENGFLDLFEYYEYFPQNETREA